MNVYNIFFEATQNCRQDFHPWLLIWMSAGNVAKKINKINDAKKWYLKANSYPLSANFEIITDAMFTANLYAHALTIDPTHLPARKYLSDLVNFLRNGVFPTVYAPGVAGNPSSGWFGPVIDKVSIGLQGGDLQKAITEFTDRFTFAYC